jgi:hypothetical protein
MRLFPTTKPMREWTLCLAMAVVLGSASAQDLDTSGAGPAAGSSRSGSNLLNGGASSFQPPASPLLSPDIGSGTTKAGVIVSVTDVGVDLYQSKKSKTQIAVGVGTGLAKGFAYSQAGGLVGGLIGGAVGGPPGAAAGYEIGTAGTTALLTA